MNTTNRTRKVLAVAALLLGLGALQSVDATTILSDNFNSGTAGTTLTNSSVQYYDTASYGTAPVWLGTSGAIYSPTTSGVITTATTGASIQAWAPITDKNTGVLTLQADIRVGNADWIGLGFMNNGSNWFDTNNAVFAILNTTGYITTMKNGATSLGVSSQVASFSNTSTYTFKLVYDLDVSTVSTYINGTLKNTYTLTGLNSSVINYVGFRALSNASTSVDSPQIDNFLYDYAAVPEPSSMALLAGFGLMGLVLSRRRAS